MEKVGWMTFIVIEGMTCRKSWGCENTWCAPEMVNHPGWWSWGLRWEKWVGWLEVEVSGRFLECQEEALGLDPEGFEKTTGSVLRTRKILLQSI